MSIIRSSNIVIFSCRINKSQFLNQYVVFINKKKLFHCRFSSSLSSIGTYVPFRCCSGQCVCFFFSQIYNLTCRLFIYFSSYMHLYSQKFHLLNVPPWSAHDDKSLSGRLQKKWLQDSSRCAGHKTGGISSWP